jgi:hypothetical protein
MTRDDIIRMAQEAGFNEYILENVWSHETCEFFTLLENFANLVAGHETCEFAALKKEVEELRAENSKMREVMMASYAPRPWVRK